MEAIVEENGRSVPQNYELPPLRNESERDPPFFSHKNFDLPLKEVSYPKAREWTGTYFACAQHIDAQVGVLLDALELLGLRSSTVIIVQGDHGYSLGRHGVWSKYVSESLPREPPLADSKSPFSYSCLFSYTFFCTNRTHVSLTSTVLV